MKKRIIAIALCGALAVGGAVGGTIAWLTDSTDSVVNTFTVGNINIDLSEHALDSDGSLTSSETMENSYKMIPGTTLNKDPFVTVKAGSEKCYVFVKANESIGDILYNNEAMTFADFMSYEMDASWKVLDATNGVYYQVVDASSTDTVLNVIKDKQVTVNDTVTKPMMDALEDAQKETPNASVLPQLTFTAYAVQFDNIGTPATDDAGELENAKLAWEEANK